MDIVEIVGWVLAVVGVGAAVYFKVASGKDVETLSEGFYQKSRVAREAVEAVQQLWESGQIPEADNGNKVVLFNKAADFIRIYFPDLTDAQMEMTIESAVFWLKQASKGLTEAEG